MTPRIGAVVQARFSSRRLPGKVLRPLQGRPMLAWQIERLQSLGDRLDTIVLATSTEDDDDAVAAFAASSGIACHRGPLDDVAGRMLDAARRFALDAVVRLSGDSPLLDPALVARAIDLYRDAPCDLATNVQIRSFPKGQSVEVIRVAALEEALLATTDPADREHVTPFFYAHPDRFRIRNFAAATAHPALQLSVDTPEDFARVEAMVALMTAPPLSYGVDALVDLAARVAGRAA